MEEERRHIKESTKVLCRNKRTSDVFEECLDDNQNKPPVNHTQSSKRPRRDDFGEGPSSDMGPPPPVKPDACDDNVTPNAFVSVSSSQTAPGAPRILLVSQQVNAEHHPTRREASMFYQLLRTPPSEKNNRLYLRRNSSEEHRGFDRFTRVSDEIILRIFHHLPRHVMCTLALVCRRWARIVCDHSLWKRIDMAGRAVKAGTFKILLERGVEVLRLNRSEIMGDFSSTVLGAPDPRRSPLSEERMYRLQLLDMSMANVQTGLVESMVKFCPNLRKISLESITVSEQLLINLGVNSPYLEVLNLSMCLGTTGKGLTCIFDNCTSLKQLNIAWTYMSREDLQLVCKKLPKSLLALDISGNREKLSNSDITNICHRCPNLLDLDLSDTTGITMPAIEAIIMHCKRLQKVSLSRCYSLSPTHLLEIMKLKDLKVINIFGMLRDSGLIALEERFKRYRVNKEPFSTIARPTTTNSRKGASMWGILPKYGPCV